MFTFEICAIIILMVLGGILCAIADRIPVYHGKHEKHDEES